MGNGRFDSLLQNNPGPEFVFIDPPFNFNAAGVVKYPLEVSGFYLLNSLCRRLGWSSLSGKRLLDYGCGVRFTRTLTNLGIDIGAYTGIDINKTSLAWLKENVQDPRFRFECLDMGNPKYNRAGSTEIDTDLLTKLGIEDYDAACMYSVITHQTPEEATVILSMLRKSIPEGGDLYFTGLIDDTIAEFAERDPDRPGQFSVYNPDFLIKLVEATGWKVKATYPRSTFQQSGFHCR